MTKKPQVAVFIGAGIMSATLSILLKKIIPDIHISVFEKLDSPGLESSQALNNAGTGHSAFCELNYTSQDEKGEICIDKAVQIAKQFEISKEFWSYLLENGYLSSVKNIIRNVPHMSFVKGQENVNFLKNRHASLVKHPLFSDMLYSEDVEQIKEWAPLLFDNCKKDEVLATTFMNIGTDVNFGELTAEIFSNLQKKEEIELYTNHEIENISKENKEIWNLDIKDILSNKKIKKKADFVFIGAGGYAVLLLQKSKIKEAKNYGGFPVGGEWLICQNEEIVNQHNAKVYGKAKLGAPPMSVPHLDTRIINGKKSLLFGPFATFSTKFLKNGSLADFFKSIQFNNLEFMLNCGLSNLDLTKYLISQVMLSKKEKVAFLRDFIPDAKDEDWFVQKAGQRVQVIENQKGKGILKFGTEIVKSEDGSLAALLGASPGASTSVYAMINLLKKCLPDYVKDELIKEMIPNYGENFDLQEVVQRSRSRTSETLQL